MKPLTDRQRAILKALLTVEDEWYGMTGNQIGLALGFRTGSDRYAHDGRMMGAANRVIGSLQGLERRGLVTLAARRDGMSGTAYRLTQAGIEEARKIWGHS